MVGVGERIKELRTEKGLTQKDLADKLFVTAQAVSRWEKGEVEPSVSTLSEMSKIFGVSTDELLGIETKEPQVVVKTEYVHEGPQKPVLGVCEICKNPIYEKDDYILIDERSSRHTYKHVYCKSCNDKMEAEKRAKLIKQAKSLRIKSFIFGGIAAAALIVMGILNFKNGGWMYFVGSIFAFTLVSCLTLDNNFVRDLVESIMSFGFVTFPGIIFDLDIDGLIFLIIVKAFFWLLECIIVLITAMVAIAVGGVCSLITYPFALKKNIKHPEKRSE